MSPRGSPRNPGAAGLSVQIVSATTSGVTDFIQETHSSGLLPWIGISGRKLPIRKDEDLCSHCPTRRGGVIAKPDEKAQLAPQLSKADLALGHREWWELWRKESSSPAKGDLRPCASQSQPCLDNGPVSPELPILHKSQKLRF